MPALLDDDWFGFGPDDDPGGTAGVREPRHPKPVRPMSGAGAKPMPEEFVHLVLTG